MKKIIKTENAPAAIGPYSQAVMANGMLYMSGQIALVPETGEVVDEGIEAQTIRVLRNMEGVLSEAGLTFDDVVKTTVFLTDMEDFGVVNSIYGEKFAEMRKYAGKFENSMDESDDVNTDWQDLMYRNGFVTSHDVNISGGTQGGNYSFGGAYYKDQGVIPTQNYTRYSLRGSFDQGVGKYFRFGLTTNSNYNVTKGNNIGLYGVLSVSPIANPYNEDGTLKRTVKYNSQDEAFVMTRDVVENLEEKWLNESKGFGTYNNLFAEVQCPWIKGLKYRMNLGLNYRST